MVQVISGEKRFLVRFQHYCKNYLSLNQFAIVIVEKILVETEPEFLTNHEIPEEKVTLQR